MVYTKKILLVLSFIILCIKSNVTAQVVFQDIEKYSIYEFLDEMANMKLIRTNTAVKPYSREFIANCLIEIQEADSILNKRQLSELNFYLKDFQKELQIGKYESKRFDIFYYNDSLFTFSLNGIFGGEIWNNANGYNYHRWYGAEAISYVGEHLGIYASLRDNSELERLSDTGIVTIRNGGKYRSGDYSEMRGGITWGWKWGHIALVKDYAEWGVSYRYPNIISSKAPSFAQLKLQLKPVEWFEFNYIHGWLVSGIVDSSRSYEYNGEWRGVYHERLLTANMFTFYPWRYLNFSIGNAILYSDQGSNPVYLIPVLFYKSVDHSYGGAASNSLGQNSMMYFAISSRNMKNIHVYYSMFIDVMSFSSLFEEESNANHWSMIWGAKYSNLLPNLSLTVEYIRNHPLVYKNEQISFYSSNGYSLGHYLGDNAQEIYAEVDFRPIPKFKLKAWFSLAQKGPDYKYKRGKDPTTGKYYILGKTFMESVEWEQQQIGFRASYQVANDWYFFVSADKRNLSGNYQKYTASYYQNADITYSCGMNFGF